MAEKDIDDFLLQVAHTLQVKPEKINSVITAWKTSLGEFCTTTTVLRVLVSKKDRWDKVGMDEAVKAVIEDLLTPLATTTTTTSTATGVPLSLSSILGGKEITVPLLPKIPTWIDRGKDVNKEIDSFLRSNLDNRKSRDKHDHSFLYIMNGSGYGKTWTGFYIAHYLKHISSGTNHILFNVYLDFTNGSAWNENIDHCPSISLGIRIAASLIYKCSLREFLAVLPTANRSSFEFSEVMKWISESVNRPPHSYIVFLLHLDEMQGKPNLAQEMLHVIGDYMCSTDTTTSSHTLQHRVIIYPVITGTSSKNFKQKVTDYGTFRINLQPFNYQQSLELLLKRNIEISCWHNQKHFKRLVKSCGGLPRCLQYLADTLIEFDCKKPLTIMDTQIIYDKKKEKLSRSYKFNEQEQKFGGMENLKLILSLSINAITVTYGMILRNGYTIEDIMKEGVIFLKPSKKGTGIFKIILPLVIMDCLNCSYNIFPVKFDVVFRKTWDWSSFEEWDCYYQLIKNNSCLWLTQFFSSQSKIYQSDMGTLYNSKILKMKEVQLSNLIGVAQEKHQFLKRNTETPSQPSDTIDTDVGNVGEIDFGCYSFRCCTGNPSVDSRNFHLAHQNDLNKIPWMICKQYKHSVSDSTKLSLKEMNDSCIDWYKRLKNYFPRYRCILVLITNQIVEENDIIEIEKKNYAAVICRNNFGKYCPISFSAYSIFDDDCVQEQEEMLSGVTEVEIPDVPLNDTLDDA